MKLYFIGAAHEVTGSCTLLCACGKNILIDCGMEQGENVYENVDIPIAPNEIDALFLTHAHIDHSGHIPYITANGFSAPIYTTKATTNLCKIMLLDSAHIQEFEAQWKNRKNKRSGKELVEPLYTTHDAENAMKYFTPCDYEKQYDIFDGIKIRFIDAGHLLGSASIQIEVTENGETKTILFSGDVGNVDRPLIKNPNMPPSADYVIIESTYGNRLHGARPDYVAQLTRIIQSTFEAGRIRHHLKHNLWRKECTIMFVGYQAEGTLGRKILEGAKSVTLFGEEVQVNAKIEKMEGISGHADRDMLLAWLSAMPEKPKVVFVNHGHDTVCDEFAKTIELKLDTPALAPYSGDGFELGDTVRQVDVGPRKLYNKKLYKIERNNTVYDRLCIAGQNLMSVIEQNRGCANKDIAKFTDQILALCEKYKMD